MKSYKRNYKVLSNSTLHFVNRVLQYVLNSEYSKKWWCAQFWQAIKCTKLASLWCGWTRSFSLPYEKTPNPSKPPLESPINLQKWRNWWWSLGPLALSIPLFYKWSWLLTSIYDRCTCFSDHWNILGSPCMFYWR